MILLPRSRRRFRLFTIPFLIAIFLGLFSASFEAREPTALESFGGELSASIEAGDPSVLDRHLDVDGLLDRILRDIEIDEAQRVEFRQGFRKGLDSNRLLQGVLGQSFRFLRIREFEGRPRLFFRLLLEAGGLNYLVFDCRTDAAGEIRVVDFYMFATGEWLSESIRRLVLPALAQANRTLIEKVFSRSDAEYIKYIEDVGEMSMSYQRGDFAAVASRFESLPQTMQEQKLVNVTYLSALAEIEEREEDYKTALGRFEKLFPGDPALKLMLVDYHMLNKNWKAMFDSLDWLEEKVGGDPYADVLRASGMIFREDWAAAIRYARQAMEREPGLVDAHWTFVTAALNNSDHAAALEGLQTLRDDFGYTFDAQMLREEPLYRDFMQSPQAKVLFGTE